ncbi:MBL fold metallo-hydrolase [Palleronia sp. KMU-117]|uniref:MBL fold metallo-hydrolase n=1 Tax=Palleronia sp. KMU-117 TaxID=3434108 RepID=UPI003D7190F9
MNRIVLLGVKGGPAIRQGGAMPTATLVELDGRRILVDCGIGATRSLVEAGVDLRTLDLVLITHLHSDHVLELGPLLHTAWTTGLARPIRVLGPAGIDGYWQGFLASMAVDTAIRVEDEGRRPLTDLVDLSILAEGEVLNEPGLTLRALEVPHPPIAPCYALRIDGSRSVVLSGDTAHHPPLAAFAQGADVLVHEAMLPEGVEEIVRKTGLGDRLRAHLHAAHTTADHAARIARGAGVGRLVLNHLIPVDDPRFTEADWLARCAGVWNGPVTVGRDGLEIAL